MLTTPTPAQREDLLPLPVWMRAALWTTGVLNLFGALICLPQFAAGRALVSLPPAD